MDGRRIKIKRKRRGRLIKTLLIKTGERLQTTVLRGSEQSANVNASAGSQKRLMRSLHVFLDWMHGSFSPKKRRSILPNDVCQKIMFCTWMFQVLVSSTFALQKSHYIRTRRKKISIHVYAASAGLCSLLIDSSRSMK